MDESRYAGVKGATEAADRAVSVPFRALRSDPDLLSHDRCRTLLSLWLLLSDDRHHHQQRRGRIDSS